MLDDQLAKRVRHAAEAQGISISAFIAKTLDNELNRGETSEALPFRLVTVRGSRPRFGVNLDRPREIEMWDDVARYGDGLVDPM